jgi:hypothetical protein
MLRGGWKKEHIKQLTEINTISMVGDTSRIVWDVSKQQ